MKKPNSLTAGFVLMALCTIGFSSIVAATAATKEADRVVPGHAAIAPLSMPTVDISGETNRHIIIAQGTEKLYQGHPSTVLMPDGKTMFCVWTLNHGWGEPFIRRSDDAGRTWLDVAVPASWNPWCKATHRPGSSRGGSGRGWLPVIHYLKDPQGKGRLVIFDRGENNRLIQSVSEDEGKTWTPMRPNGLCGIEPSMNIIPTRDGKRLLMWNTDWTPGVFQAESPDGGLTWANERDVIDTSGVPGVTMIEPGVIRSPDGVQLLMFIRDFKGGAYNSLYSVSNDDGATWSKPKRLTAGLTGDRHAPLYAPDGRLIVAMRDTLRNGTTPTLGHFIAWVGRYEDVAQGRDGQYRVKLLHSHAGKDCAYPSLQLLPDGTVVATTYIKYADGPAHQSVVSTRFTIEELDAMLKEKRNILSPLSGLGPNEDEQPLITGTAAVLKPTEGEVRPLVLNQPIFSNRKYLFQSLPESFAGRSFVFSPIETTKAICRKAGIVYVFTPRPARNTRGSLEAALLKQGFTRAAVPEFSLFPGNANLCSVYQKRIEVGDPIVLGMWGVLVF
ncbi:MAG: exo-alpha-sialidase [Verrucomicrobia bacterium]|nr:exo-alpha-sialidase [Verrucomicrobiota bacterium]